MSARPDIGARLRPMRRDDVADVVAIEHACYDYPWTERIFHDCLRVGYRAWVALDGIDRVAGYGLLSVAVGEAHVLNLCVDASVRGQGFAPALLDAMIEQAHAEHAETLFLEVRPSNRAARRLYKRYGFRRIATRPGYYPARDGREDALMLSLNLLT